uniref:(northern house mosquito) hypothetical protein n=1 Tax=Culex pipiens TaxID=7175 RepID=A0A8D7ZYV4_CULPI
MWLMSGSGSRLSGWLMIKWPGVRASYESGDAELAQGTRVQARLDLRQDGRKVLVRQRRVPEHHSEVLLHTLHRRFPDSSHVGGGWSDERPLHLVVRQVVLVDSSVEIR